MADFATTMASALLKTSSVIFEVDESWSQGRTIFGGMQASMAVRAMRHLIGGDVPLRSFQVTFVGPVRFGAVEVQANVLRKGKFVVQAEARIREAGETRLLAVGVFGADRPSEIDIRPPLAPPAPGWDEAEEVSYGPDEMPVFTKHFEVRPARKLALFSGEKDPRGAHYAAFRGENISSIEHLVAISDMVPPLPLAAVTKAATGSVTNWQLELFPGSSPLESCRWVRVDAEMAAGAHGYCWQDGRFSDAGGRIIMITRQCVAFYG